MLLLISPVARLDRRKLSKGRWLMACRILGVEETPGSHLGIQTSSREKMAKVRVE